jgi:hypothetical protein
MTDSAPPHRKHHHRIPRTRPAAPCPPSALAAAQELARLSIARDVLDAEVDHLKKVVGTAAAGRGIHIDGTTVAYKVPRGRMHFDRTALRGALVGRGLSPDAVEEALAEANICRVAAGYVQVEHGTKVKQSIQQQVEEFTAEWPIRTSAVPAVEEQAAPEHADAKPTVPPAYQPPPPPPTVPRPVPPAPPPIPGCRPQPPAREERILEPDVLPPDVELLPGGVHRRYTDHGTVIVY